MHVYASVRMVSGNGFWLGIDIDTQNPSDWTGNRILQRYDMMDLKNVTTAREERR